MPHIKDWLKGEIASYLFGGNEPPGKLFTRGHALVIIDSEQMFSSSPSDVRQGSWWNNNNGAISTIARQITVDLCAAVAELSDMNLREFLATPKGIHIPEIKGSMYLKMPESLRRFHITDRNQRNYFQSYIFVGAKTSRYGGR